MILFQRVGTAQHSFLIVTGRGRRAEPQRKGKGEPDRVREQGPRETPKVELQFGFQVSRASIHTDH